MVSIRRRNLFHWPGCCRSTARSRGTQPTRRCSSRADDHGVGRVVGHRAGLPDVVPACSPAVYAYGGQPGPAAGRVQERLDRGGEVPVVVQVALLDVRQDLVRPARTPRPLPAAAGSRSTAGRPPTRCTPRCRCAAGCPWRRGSCAAPGRSASGCSWHWARAAASRTFWTAGRSRPIRMAMMAITTSSSISVNADRRDGSGPRHQGNAPWEAAPRREVPRQGRRRERALAGYRATRCRRAKSSTG